MSARTRNEDGAALILALVFITLVAVAAMVLASLGFSSQKAAVVYSDQTRVANALDSGVQAAIENARVPASVPAPFGCGADVDLPAVNKRHVQVTCVADPNPPPAADTRARLVFTAKTLDRPICPAEQDPSLVATVVLSTIGGSPTGARIARTTGWKLVPTPCP